MTTHLRRVMLFSLLCLTTFATSVSAESDWVLWVSSETEPWLPTFKFYSLAECEQGLRGWIKDNEGFWGKGDPGQRRSGNEGGYGLWSPVANGHAWGVVEDNKTGARRRVELLCLPDTAVPRESRGTP
jgi:hypothetical protein